MSEKLYGVNVGISGAEGYQTLGVKASSQEEALEKFKKGYVTGDILFSEVEVTGLDDHGVGLGDIEVWEDESILEKDTRYHVNSTFPSKEVAQDFVSWMCGQGEQSMWDYDEYSDESDLNREIKYDYEKGSFEIGNKFDE